MYRCMKYTSVCVVVGKALVPYLGLSTRFTRLNPFSPQIYHSLNPFSPQIYHSLFESKHKLNVALVVATRREDIHLLSLHVVSHRIAKGTIALGVRRLLA